MRTLLLAFCLAAIGLLEPHLAVSAQPSDWPAYGGDKAGTRYSSLAQINKQNVSKLKVAWTFDTEEGRGDAQTQPIAVGGVLYAITPKHRIIALNAATGKLIWKFDSGLEGRGPNRGLTYWSDGKASRILVGIQSFLYALDAATGKPIESFGSAGRIDLREGLGRDAAKASIVLTSPGIIHKNLIIVGGRMPEALPSAPGDIRSFDVQSGKLVWSFHTIPRPGEMGYDTWPKDAWTYTGSANNWCGMALDEATGTVYVPTGSAASDFYGYDRLGDNLFANSLLALDAATGKRRWHFQGVQHDIWDRDFPSPPTLVTVRKNGTSIPAVAQATKQGVLYVFNRKTGQSIFPIKRQPFLSSSTPGEQASGTQPVPLKPAPFARQRLTANLLTDRTPEAHDWAVQAFQKFRSDGQFVPLSTDRDTVIFPGFDGGAEWGGSAFDPDTGIYYVNANDLPWTSGLALNTAGNSGKQLYQRNCAVCHGDDRAGAPPQIPSLVGVLQRKSPNDIHKIVSEGAGRMPAFASLHRPEVDNIIAFLDGGNDKELASTAEESKLPKYRFTGYKKFLDPEGYPAVKPPWGTLNAINLNTGEYAWKVPLGEYPKLAAQGMNDTGTENYGGPVVTKGGLVFIAATNFDNKIRAFDKSTGKLLWESTLPASGNATPAIYEADGRQFVVAYATGGKAEPDSKAGGAYVAFALPKE